MRPSDELWDLVDKKSDKNRKPYPKRVKKMRRHSACLGVTVSISVSRFSSGFFHFLRLQQDSQRIKNISRLCWTAPGASQLRKRK